MASNYEQEQERSFARVIILNGYDLKDDNFKDTPTRWRKWFSEFSKIDEEAFLRETLQPIFPDPHEELVIVSNVRFVSICPHHTLPVLGVGHIGYIPSTKGVVGLSKLARALKGLAHQMILQERLCRILADGISEVLEAQGVMVVLKAEHGCMSVRGIEDDQISTITSAVRGVFETDEEGVKSEFLRLIALSN